MQTKQAKSGDQASLDAYFIERRRKEIRRLIIAVFAMVIGVPIAGFAEPIAEYLEVTKGLVDAMGLIVNLCGFALLAMWIMDGKEYVFPTKRSNQN